MKFRLIAGLTGFLVLISGALSAQIQNDQNDQDQGQVVQDDQGQADQTQSDQAQTEQTQSEHSVARISLTHGDVSTQRGDSGDWTTAVLNQPMVSGDHLSTGDNGRAELQLDHSNILRIDERTQANISALTRNQIQVQLARGLANFTVLKDSEADVQIDTPNLSVHPGRSDASVRIQVVSDDHD